MSSILVVYNQPLGRLRIYDTESDIMDNIDNVTKIRIVNSQIFFKSKNVNMWDCTQGLHVDRFELIEE